MNTNTVEFYNYLQPILNTCSGFIKTDGYMTHFPGTVVIMSADEMYCSIINIPIIFDIYVTANINTFMSIKDDALKTSFDPLYFIGWNIKQQKLMEYYNKFNGIEKHNCIYYEPDCYTIPKFSEVVSLSSIGKVVISNGSTFYRIPVSKAITPLTKFDSVNMRMYDTDIENIKTVVFSLYKYKFKITVNVYSNIIMLF